MFYRHILIPYLVLAALHSAIGIEDSLNVLVQPQARECFYEDVTTPQKLNIEVFVQSGGKSDVLLEVFGPLTAEHVRQENLQSPVISAVVTASEQEKSDTQSYIHEFLPTSAGTYAMCVSNTHARFMPKRIQFKVSTDAIQLKTTLKDSPVDETVKASIRRIKAGLEKIQQQQIYDRHRLSMHSETNVSSHNNVVIGSVVETVVFILAAMLQVYFVRVWFLSKSAAAPMKQWA